MGIEVETRTTTTTTTTTTMPASPTRRCRPLLLAASGFGIALLCAAAVKAWILAGSWVRPPGSFLIVELRGEITQNEGVHHTLVGDIEYHTASSTFRDAQLTIVASPVPGFVTAVVTDDMVYRYARDELLESHSAHATRWTRCRHAGHSCRALRYRTADGRRGRAQLFLEGGEVVVLDAVYGDDALVADAFFASAR